ncbi:hypothetical protein CDV36_006312 [Fusarium kuroshium]|uniref:Uncharacterized protein n=1 Tax=Fusarium kuroshium TaxID=2010991 RepID=A0A3M2S8V9_9HYPO|nr:hypothetical protein CDV36_006312 [Fusarium kuroshium]
MAGWLAGSQVSDPSAGAGAGAGAGLEVLAADHHLIGRGPSSFGRSIRFTLPNLLLEPPSPHIFAALVSLPPPPLAASSSPLLLSQLRDCRSPTSPFSCSLEFCITA